jgi:hypothetical protein
MGNDLRCKIRESGEGAKSEGLRGEGGTVNGER